MNYKISKKLRLLEFTIAVTLAVTLTYFFSFKTQNALLEAIESSYVAHSASLVHMRSYVHLVEVTDNMYKDTTGQLLTEIQALNSELIALSEASDDIHARFPHFFWLGDTLPSITGEYINTANKQLALLEIMLQLKHQDETTISLASLEKLIFSEKMDEATEHIHEYLIDNIFITNKAIVFTLILSTFLLFSVVVLYLNRYISELKDTKLALQNAVNKAEEASLAKSMFLATMSHEIRTPMNGVIGMTQILISDNKDPKMQAHLDTLLESSEHLMAVINEILDFLKLGQGKLEFIEEVFVAEQLLMPIKNAFYPQANDKNIQLLFDINSLPKSLVLAGDKTRIRQIVYNLVGNAIKFTSDGHVKVSLEYDTDKEELSIQVSDTGIGIPNARLEGIFNAFEQADTTIMHNFGGTGLGLSIVKKLCLAMGGDVAVTSELGSGSCFTATLIVPRGKRLQEQTKHSECEDYCGNSVLIVEDNRVNQLVAKRLCEKLGFTISMASNGVEAIKKVQQNTFHVILMDHQMPEMGGIEATKTIRREHQFKGVILGCTADVTTETAAAYVDAGANGVITKPFKLEALRQAIAQNVIFNHTENSERESVLN